MTDPFGYERYMTVRRVVAMLSCLWTASALLGHLPIHLGWYRDVSDQLSDDCSDVCEFNVNRVYGTYIDKPSVVAARMSVIIRLSGINLLLLCCPP